MHLASRIISLAAIAGLSACAELASSPSEPDLDARARGAIVAERGCSSCHQVTPERGAAREAAAPSFMEIANLPGRTRDYLRSFATQRHVVETVGSPQPVMPTLYLSPEDREDVILHILGFQRPDAPTDAAPKKVEPFE